jgi:hypothetical protein
MEPESRTMKALSIVLQHTGTQNRKKLQSLVKTTENLEYAIKLKNYQENMNAWSLADINTLQRAHEALNELKRKKVCPFDTHSENDRALDKDFSNKFSNPTQMKYCLQMMASRGYTCLVFKDEVHFIFGVDDPKYEYLEMVCATPNPMLVLPSIYPSFDPYLLWEKNNKIIK